MTTKFGHLVSTVIGYAMREMVGVAIKEIQSQLDTFTATAKAGSDGVYDDLVTSADIAAQRIYVERISANYPTFGIIGEENALSIPCTEPENDVYFTIDPLDGTKAYGRRQSHGIGTMIALVVDGEVEAAFIGDVMTGEIYGYSTGHSVQRIRPSGAVIDLSIDSERSLSAQYLLLRENPVKYKPLMRGMTTSKDLFKDLVVEGSSIGIGAARLWKGEVGAMALIPKKVTPWDDTPVIGISRKMGFIFFKVTDDGLVEYQPELIKEEYVSNDEQILMIHESRRDELLKWVMEAKRKKQGSADLDCCVDLGCC